MSDVLDDLMGIYSTLLVDSTPDYEIIKSTINKQHTYIEFLQEKIREKNLLIKMLNFRNANDGDKIDIGLLNENQLSEVEITSMTTTRKPNVCVSDLSFNDSRDN